MAFSFPISNLKRGVRVGDKPASSIAGFPISQLIPPIRLVDKEIALHGFFFSYFQPKKVPRTFLATQICFSDFVGFEEVLSCS